ncbi:uncharacterized protein RJT21DRAFT_129494 [Scheffersomyces amazonensis]|uniref:uncharacterized protein n=1 Tax=Scheffersomyces amazonensis TaxID=1078765 RepID=UPI00315D6718
MIDGNQQAPNAPFRSLSTSSNISLNSSSTSITRVPSGPIQTLNVNFNRQSTPQDHLYFKAESLKQRISKIQGMDYFLRKAYNVAEGLAEQQALALSQQIQQDNNGFRSSIDSSNSDNSTSSKSQLNNIHTFTAGILPANISVDPATLLWSLFQQGAPLCLILNYVIPSYEVPVLQSDDLRMCKKSVYDFLIAVKSKLKFDDEFMFTISNVFSDSTNDLLTIIRVVNKVLDSKEEARFEIDKDSPQPPIGEVIITDDRSKVVKELIETERKYLQDLELLSKYQKELLEAEILPNEQIHSIFPNLTEIIDFQRRFLMGLECNINVPYKYQRIGSVFIHASKGPFKVYEPWTVGQLNALDIINKEAVNLKKSSTLLDPGFELQSYVIKPIQRLCKYPLLLKELIKNAPESIDSNIPTSAVYNELVMARSAMTDVANQVNEAQRRSENVEYVSQLYDRVSNWRGFNLKDQGELLHHGTVGVKDAELEKEYVAYLFERIIFFFVELPLPEVPRKKILSSRKKSTSSSASVSTANLLESLTSAKNDKLTQLELKGRVYISEIYNISAPSNLGYTLVISWSGKKESGSFTLRYRTEEIRNQWENCLRTLKANEMNSHIHKKLRDSQASNDSTIYDYTAAYAQSNGSPPNVHDSQSSRSSNGSTRHHSSSSTFSMMRSARARSGGFESSRLSGGQLGSQTTNTPITAAVEGGFTGNEILVKVIYNSKEIPDAIIVSSNIQFTELYSKISSKVASSQLVSDDILVNKLKYKDEDGDFVVMDSNDDWILAVDMVNEFMIDSDDKRELTIWVS